jgi:hypothetical protein
MATMYEQATLEADGTLVSIYSERFDRKPALKLPASCKKLSSQESKR